MIKKEVRHRVNQHRLKSEKENRTCFKEGCSKKAIHSHILQKNGVLDRICEDRHLAEYVNTPFDTQATFGFKKSGKKEAFKFKGFCYSHDNSIFSDIEKQDFNLINYHHLILFSYRALVSEIRKNEIALSSSKRIFEDAELPVEVRSFFRPHHCGQRL